MYVDSEMDGAEPRVSSAASWWRVAGNSRAFSFSEVNFNDFC